VKALIKTPTAASPELLDIPRPVLQHGHVLIKPRYLGLCRTDLYVASNRIAIKEDLILGHEFSGVVLKVGSMSAFKEGDLVVVNPVTKNGFMGLNVNGALCEEVSIPEALVYPIPSGLDLVSAVYFEPIAAALGLQKFKEHISINSPLLVVGNNRIADLSKLICTTLDLPFVSVDSDDLTAHTKSYMCVLETELNQYPELDVLLNRLLPGGHLICKSRTRVQANFTPNTLVYKNLTIHGVSYGSWSWSLPWLLLHKDKIKPLLGPIYPLNDWKEAFQEAFTNERTKVIIEVNT
jgi:threonine dehydrogenase-like Zn-dependent dehydrogenase